MPTSLTILDLNIFIIVKLIFFAFIASSVWGIYRTYKPFYFVALTSIAVSGSFVIFMRHLGLTFGGLTGDDVTVAAMFQTYAHVSLFADFAYHGLPAFYPPLFFWMGGILGAIFHWNGVQIATRMAAMTLFALPMVMYVVQWWYWRRDNTAEKPARVAWMFAPLLLYLVIDQNAQIGKSYEMASAMLTILWAVFLMHDVARGKLSWHRVMTYGITGGVLFLLFYFWFFLVAIGVSLFHLMTHIPDRMKTWGMYCVIGAIILAVGSVYWLPLAQSYVQYGSENWQTGFFLLSGIAYHGPMDVFSLMNIILVIGLVSLIRYRKNLYIRALGMLLVAGYVWQLMGLCTLLLFDTPIQEAKAFFFFNRAVLVLSASFALEQLWRYVTKKSVFHTWRMPIQMLAVLMLALGLFFGTFSDREDIQALRATNRAPNAGIIELATYINEYPIEGLTLDAGIPELYGFASVNHVIYYNQNNSHPAARFSDRITLLEDMSHATSSHALYDMMSHNAVGQIERIIVHNTGEDTYTFYFYVDNFPYVNTERVIHIPAHLFASPYFDRVYESDQFVVFEPTHLSPIEMPDDIGMIDRGVYVKNQDTLFVSTHTTDKRCGVWRYQYDTWQEMFRVTDSTCFDAHVFFLDEVLYLSMNAPARLYRSDDMGKNWTLVLRDVDVFWSMAKNTDGVYGTLWSTDVPALYRSKDNGTHWYEWINFHDVVTSSTDAYDASGIPRMRHLHDIVADDANILVGTGDVMRQALLSQDGGQSWRDVWDEGFTAHAVLGDSWYLGADKLSEYGIARYNKVSGELHNLWNPSDVKDWEGYIYSMLVKNNTIFAATHIENNFAHDVHGYGILRSDDGEHFSSVRLFTSTDEITSLYIVDGPDDSVYVIHNGSLYQMNML